VGDHQDGRRPLQLSRSTILIILTAVNVLSFGVGTLRRMRVESEQFETNDSIQCLPGYNNDQVFESTSPSLVNEINNNHNFHSRNKRKFKQPPTISDMLSRTIKNRLPNNCIKKTNRLTKEKSSLLANHLSDFSWFTEPFVHPAMISFIEEPVRVAILVENETNMVVEGSVERASVKDITIASTKEVLKYKSVKHVAVVGIGKHGIYDGRGDCSSNNFRINNSICSSELNDERVEIFHSFYPDKLCKETDEACGNIEKRSWIPAENPQYNKHCDNTHKTNINEDSAIEDSGIDAEDYSENYLENESSYDEEDSNSDSAEINKYDIIILMDAFEVLSQKNGDAAYKKEDDKASKKETYFGIVFDALSPDGLIVMSLGNPSEAGFWRDHEIVVKFLETYNFHVILVYEENNCGLLKECAFLIMAKNPSFKDKWFETPASVNIQIHKMLGEQIEKSLSRFDGVSMARYQYSKKIWENHFCLKTSNPPYECSTVRGINPSIKDFSARMFEVKKSSLGEEAGRGLFAKVDIPERSLFMQQEATDSVHFSGQVNDLIDKMQVQLPESKELLKKVYNYYNGYGYDDDATSHYEIFVDSGLSTFVNHGCNGSGNIGTLGVGFKITLEDHESLNENTAMHLNHNEISHRFYDTSFTYNPVISRHVLLISGGLNYALRDIKKGEEIFTNYILFSIGASDWMSDVYDIKSQCSGESIGLVSQVDTGREQPT